MNKPCSILQATSEHKTTRKLRIQIAREGHPDPVELTRYAAINENSVHVNC